MKKIFWDLATFTWPKRISADFQPACLYPPSLWPTCYVLFRAGQNYNTNNLLFDLNLLQKIWFYWGNNYSSVAWFNSIHTLNHFNIFWIRMILKDRVVLQYENWEHLSNEFKVAWFWFYIFRPECSDSESKQRKFQKKKKLDSWKFIKIWKVTRIFSLIQKFQWKIEHNHVLIDKIDLDVNILTV